MPLPMEVTEEMVQKVAKRLHGGAGLSGVDAVKTANWLSRFGEESQQLREEMAMSTMWFSNESPPWAALRAFSAGRLIALDKQQE